MQQEFPVESFNGIIGKSKSIQQIFTLIKKVSDGDSTVLITGESGTGKELVARAIHNESDRRDKPFTAINCGAIPETLMESELFGYEKGAFTGANHRRIGKIEATDQGTLFLDEIAEMSYSMQVKLLRVLQKKQLERVGGITTVELNIRIVAATNKNLEQAIKDNKFREDLYYRLNVIPLSLPPLRERREDIPLLINYFLYYFNKTKDRNISAIVPLALKVLNSYTWPGNVRELINIIERMVILTGEGEIGLDDIPEKILHAADIPTKNLLVSDDQESDRVHVSIPFSGTFPNSRFIEDLTLPPEGIPLKETLDHFEKKMIVCALEQTGWVKNKAAKLLGLNRTTLVEKIKKIGIENTEEE